MLVKFDGRAGWPPRIGVLPGPTGAAMRLQHTYPEGLGDGEMPGERAFQVGCLMCRGWPKAGETPPGCQ